MNAISWKRIIIGLIIGIVFLTIIDFLINTNFMLKLIPSLGQIEYTIRGCAVEGQEIDMWEQKCCPGLHPIDIFTYNGSTGGIHPNTYPLVCIK